MIERKRKNNIFEQVIKGKKINNQSNERFSENYSLCADWMKTTAHRQNLEILLLFGVMETQPVTVGTNLCRRTIVAVLWAAAARKDPFIWHDWESRHVLFGVKGQWNLVFGQTQSQQSIIGNYVV